MPYNITCFYYRVDRDRSGTITANELQAALSNGNYDFFSCVEIFYYVFLAKSLFTDFHL